MMLCTFSRCGKLRKRFRAFMGLKEMKKQNVNEQSQKKKAFATL